MITGCANETLEAGKTVESLEVKAALELLRLSTRSFMQTRFQVREIDVSKGYCLLVTDKNRTRVTFGFDNLDAQLQRLEQFLVFSDDSKQRAGNRQPARAAEYSGHFREAGLGGHQRDDRSRRARSQES